LLFYLVWKHIEKDEVLNMDTKSVLQEFEKVAAYYITELERYSDDQFAQKPSADQWSVGQMYNHLIQFCLFVQLKAIDACASLHAPTNGEKSEAGQQIFQNGGFPPVKIKVPASPEFTPKNPESKEEVKQNLLSVIDKVREAESKLASIPPDRQVAHPRLGYLNAVEWFQLVVMHFKHHLRQKQELDSFLGLTETKIPQ
jgi:hypothetical protein